MISPRSIAISILIFLVAVLPWLIWPFGPIREPMVDLKYPVASFGILLFAVASFRITRPILNLKNPLGLASTFMIAGLIISAINHPSHGAAYPIIFREITFIAFAWLISVSGLEAATIKRIIIAYAISASLQAALTLIQLFGHSPDLSGRASMIGTLGNPEYVASWLAPALSAALVLWIAAPISDRSSRFHALFLFGTAMLSAASIFLSGGRGAALSVTVGLVVSFGTLILRGVVSPAQIHFRFGVLSVALILPLILFLMLNPGSRTQSLIGRTRDAFNPDSASIRHRIGLFSITTDMIRANPWTGCGPGRFAAAFDLARGERAKDEKLPDDWNFNEFMGDQSAAEAHCDPLQWWAEYGLLPIMGLMFAIISGLFRLVRQIKTEYCEVAILLAAALLTMTVGMMFGFPLHRPDRAILFWFLLGCSHAQIFNPNPKT